MVYVVVLGQICNLISVVVIAIRFKFVAQIIFCAAGVIIGRTKWLNIHFRIRLHVVIRIGSLTYFICVGRIYGESSRVVPGLVCVWSFAKSRLTLISGELWLSGSCRRSSKIGVSNSSYPALAYRSSCFMMTSGSDFQSCDIFCMSGMGFLGVNKRSLMQ